MGNDTPIDGQQQRTKRRLPSLLRCDGCLNNSILNLKLNKHYYVLVLWSEDLEAKMKELAGERHDNVLKRMQKA